jgi:hypothetical protein
MAEDAGTLSSNGPYNWVPSDTAKFPVRSRALYVGGTGDLAVMRHDGGQALFTAVPAGSLLPVNVMGVFATNTTATNITVLP